MNFSPPLLTLLLFLAVIVFAVILTFIKPMFTKKRPREDVSMPQFNQPPKPKPVVAEFTVTDV